MRKKNAEGIYLRGIHYGSRLGIAIVGLFALCSSWANDEQLRNIILDGNLSPFLSI